MVRKGRCTSSAWKELALYPGYRPLKGECVPVTKREGGQGWLYLRTQCWCGNKHMVWITYILGGAQTIYINDIPSRNSYFYKKVYNWEKVSTGLYQEAVDFTLIRDEYESTRQHTFLPLPLEIQVNRVLCKHWLPWAEVQKAEKTFIKNQCYPSLRTLLSTLQAFLDSRILLTPHISLSSEMFSFSQNNQAIIKRLPFTWQYTETILKKEDK